MKGCFNNLIYTKVWRHRGEHDILHVLKHYKERIKKSIFLHLHRDGPIKFYITLKVQLYKLDNKSGERHYETAYFHGATRIILNVFEFDELYNDTRNKITECFNSWIKNGSGYRLQSIDAINLNVAKYIPIHGCSYIETPKSIACKGAVVNVKNNDNMCFIWAILSALRNSDVKSNFNRVTNYAEYIHTP